MLVLIACKSFNLLRIWSTVITVVPHAAVAMDIQEGDEVSRNFCVIIMYRMYFLNFNLICQSSTYSLYHLINTLQENFSVTLVLIQLLLATFKASLLWITL